jgi:TolB-like protein
MIFKKLAVLLLALAVAGAAFAKDNLAVLPFTGGTGEEGETIAELFSFNRELNAVFTPIPRTSITRAIGSEWKFQTGTGMTDPETIMAIGKQLGANYVVAGNIGKLGSQNLLIISILKIDDLRQVAGDIQTYVNIEEIQDKLPGMARNIIEATKIDASRLDKLAVTPVQLSGAVDARVADTLAQVLSANFIRSGKYAVYPRTATLEQVQAEYSNQGSGITADENIVGIGKGENPRLVLSVVARRLGSRNMFNAAIINLESGAQVAGESVNYQTLDDGITAMESLVRELTRVSTASSSPVQKPTTATSTPSAQKPTAASSTSPAQKPTTTSSTPPAQKPTTTSSTPSAQKPTETPSNLSLANSLTWIANNAVEGGNYAVTLKKNESLAPTTLSYNGKKVRVTLIGGTAERTIRLKSKGSLFIVENGVTLTLGNNASLRGRSDNTDSLVLVNKGGALAMENGSKIHGNKKKADSGNSASSNGGGVFVYGTFTQSGGTISGNSATWGGGVYVDSSGTFTMSGGEISGNSAPWGGGVYVDSSGTFTMSGGEISGNSASSNGGGVFVSGRGTFTKQSGGIIYGSDASGMLKNTATKGNDYGHAVYVSSVSRIRNSTAGVGVTLNSGFAGGWE